MYSLTARRILDAAEVRARRAGYGGFSFRDLATDVGVKSASVHYHFPTKADLVTHLARRYREQALEALGDPATYGPAAAFDRVAATFVDSHETGDQMCLCGILGAEADALPAPVRAEVALYFEALEAWLGAALGADHAGPGPATLIAALEGLLLVARTRNDAQILHGGVAELRRTVEPD